MAGTHGTARVTNLAGEGQACEAEFLGEHTVMQIVFGPEGAEPILGVAALENVGVTIDPRVARTEASPGQAA